LAGARRAGADILVSAGLEAAARENGHWRLDTRAGRFDADILVDAAGAWADPVAAMAGVRPLGIHPYRRTMLQLRTDPAPPPRCPHVAHIGGSFYFKPEACDPCDAAPEELDVAIAIDRFERVVDWRIDALEHKWAGLRSFAPDRLPVYGFDPEKEAFFWCAGQGGFGIQTAPAAAKLAAAVLLGRLPDPEVAGIDDVWPGG
jgi:D-arginine dehydrogenase